MLSSTYTGSVVTAYLDAKDRASITIRCFILAPVKNEAYRLRKKN